MKKKVFTLIEVLIIVIIVGILATLAIPAYRNVIENAKARTCVLNERTLLGAVEAYLVENDVLPAALSKLKYRHLEKGWAKVRKEEGGWKVDLAYFIASFDKKDLAHAQPVFRGGYVADEATQCPAGANYIFDNTLPEGIDLEMFNTLNNDQVVIREDNQNHILFHIIGSDRYEVAITKGGDIEKPGIDEPDPEPDPGDDDWEDDFSCDGGRAACKSRCPEPSEPGRGACISRCAGECAS